jgi:hypothetical protein
LKMREKGIRQKEEGNRKEKKKRGRIVDIIRWFPIKFRNDGLLGGCANDRSAYGECNTRRRAKYEVSLCFV